MEVGEDVERSGGGLFEPTHHVRRAVPVDFAAAHRGIGPAYPREYKAEEVVDFGGGGYGGTGVLDVYLLLYGYSRRDAVDEVDVGFAHTSEKLSGVGGYAFGETALALCVEGVECQTGLSAAGNASHDDELAAGDFEVNIL